MSIPSSNLIALSPNDPYWGPRDVAYLNGSFYLCGDNKIYKISSDYKSKTLIAGIPNQYGIPTDGDVAVNAKLKNVNDMQAIDGKLYAHVGYSTLIEVSDVIKVLASQW